MEGNPGGDKFAPNQGANERGRRRVAGRHGSSLMPCRLESRCTITAHQQPPPPPPPPHPLSPLVPLDPRLPTLPIHKLLAAVSRGTQHGALADLQYSLRTLTYTGGVGGEGGRGGGWGMSEQKVGDKDTQCFSGRLSHQDCFVVSSLI
ncbi:hypothetical protein ACOMHN_013033 [Nucella lapillus]